MKYKPHDYQIYAIKYIEEHPLSAVLLEMGLGKTSITLTAISHLLHDSFVVRKVLIVAPLRVAKTTWKEEICKWDHLKNLVYSVAVGTIQERLDAFRKEADIYIINRENVPWLIEESGIPFDFDMVVIDELSSFKNWRAKRFKSLMKVRPLIKRVVGLTGTPSTNGFMDLFAEFKLIDMGARLGRFISQYRDAYFLPDKRNGMVVYSYKLQDGAEECIYKKISDITISMKSGDHLTMPELVKNKVSVELSDKERQSYERLKNELVLPLMDGEVTAANAAVLTGKLSQLANGAIYDSGAKVVEFHQQKLDALEDIIEAANGEPVLVVYWYKHDLERIEKRLKHMKVNYAVLSEEKSINQWNCGKVPVGLIQPASAGHGLNLQSGGHHLVWFGLTWSLELYQQTNGRLYRQGQSANTVVIQHIVAKDTIDEKILKALELKDVSQTSLMEAVKVEVNK